MRKEPGFFYRIFLLIGDALAIVFSFGFSYYYRTHIDPRPYYFTSEIQDFIISNIILLPIWLIVLASLAAFYRIAPKSTGAFFLPPSLA